jgi:SAM-dependent methyltransferase
MLVSMLHHVEEPSAALFEACRVMRPGGRLAAMIFTREDIEALWYSDYFPSTKAWMEQSHPRLSEVLRHLPGARRLPVVLQDLQDGSLATLAAHPELVLEERWRRQTSFFERLARDHPDELRAGLDRLASDLAAARRPSARGRATVLAWTKGLA